jgi:succinyl-CoA synthetase beta subunit
VRFAEVDGKALLRRHGVPVPRGVLLRPGDDPPDEVALWPGFLLKAQILEGGRGKSGLVRRFDSADGLREARRLILATLDDANTPLLLEEAIPIVHEIFIALRGDATGQRLELLIAPRGGENVEQSAKLARIPVENAGTIAPETIVSAIARLFPKELAAQVARYAARLPDIARQEDLELLEINPLALTADGSLIVCGAKIARAEAAGFRHDADEFPTSRLLAERSIAALERWRDNMA